jgi:zinc transporter 1/2/3
MLGPEPLLRLTARQEETDAARQVVCESEAESGRLGLRISAIFVILLGSGLGALLPILSQRRGVSRAVKRVFFFVKYFGSGVIVATAFIHLLAPAHEALSNPCLTGPITEYPWVEGISLMTVFLICFVELMATRYASVAAHGTLAPRPSPSQDDLERPAPKSDDHHYVGERPASPAAASPAAASESARGLGGGIDLDYTAQLTAVFVLEFGVVFHSVFIGLTLAVAGDEFTTLYTVLAFHQTFEGLGLGVRLATAPWPKRRRWTPYALALAYALSTPAAIAVGLGVRARIGSRTGLIVNGVFDSISAGILLYTGLVELMAREFLFSEDMRRAPTAVLLAAYGLMSLGAGKSQQQQLLLLLLRAVLDPSGQRTS